MHVATNRYLAADFHIQGPCHSGTATGLTVKQNLKPHRMPQIAIHFKPKGTVDDCAVGNKDTSLGQSCSCSLEAIAGTEVEVVSAYYVAFANIKIIPVTGRG